MKKIAVFSLILILVLTGCSLSKTSESNDVDDYEISEGVIENLNIEELIKKLSCLEEGTTKEEFINLFGKEPYEPKEMSADIYKYFCGDIIITLWGKELYQVCVEYDDSVIFIDLGKGEK